MNMTKELIEKFEKGDPLSNDECYALLDFFLVLNGYLHVLGEKYNLAKYPIRLNINTVECFLLARNLDIK